jgi:hypothetical protein
MRALLGERERLLVVSNWAPRAPTLPTMAARRPPNLTLVFLEQAAEAARQLCSFSGITNYLHHFRSANARRRFAWIDAI